MSQEKMEFLIGSFVEAKKELTEIKAMLSSFINNNEVGDTKTSTVFTIKQVATILGLHYNKVYELVVTNQIKSYRTSKRKGASYRITAESIELFKSKYK